MLIIITLTTSAKMGAKIPPIRPLVEHNPSILLLISVGNSSAVKEYAIASTMEMKNFPINENTMRITGGSVDKISNLLTI